MVSLVEKVEKINCIFRNELDKMVIVKIQSEGIERVIPAFGCLEFKAKADAELKVYTHEFVTMCLAARVPCSQLIA
ncbi:MAG: DUF1830 domain-containing protein [Crocosphaera sp.]|nr:DUF1830 domain-containing protein [Crocosphaera sp.]